MKTVPLTDKSISRLPSSPGVYLFRNYNKILYIGKAVSIKARVASHLKNAKLDQKEALITSQSNQISYFLTDSEFKALLYESHLIQKHHPLYNLRWKDDKSYLYIKITIKDDFPKVFTVRRENDNESVYFGPFPSQKDTEAVLAMIRKLYPFCRQIKIGKHPCFYSKIGQCNPCPNQIVTVDDRVQKHKLMRVYRRNIKQLIRILKGNIEPALKESYKTLKKLAQTRSYEEALTLRNKIQHFERLIYQARFSSDYLIHYNRSKEALDKLKDNLKVYFNKVEHLNRIECYDVSSLMQKDATASLVVFKDGLPDKSQYKRFKIKNKSLKSDFAMLEEIFERRFRKDWEKPDLIVVDGGTPQVLKVKQILLKLKKVIPLVGMAKHPDRLVINTIDKLITVRPRSTDLGFNMLRYLRDEAHRFARKYHLLLRSKRLMI